MLPAIQMMFAYNTWATNKLFAQLQHLSQEQFETTEASGHGTIQATLAHLLDVQWDYSSWFDRSMNAIESSNVHVVIPTLASAHAAWLEIDRQTQALVGALDESRIDEIWPWDIPNASRGALPLWQMLLHVANHQTHTRGQILAAIRRLGVKAEGLDLLFFLHARSLGRA
jgi:uncharacterized damage-inducible protein DinB